MTVMMDRPTTPPPIDTEVKSATQGPYEHVTFLATARCMNALSATARLTGDSRTDVINRALQVYAYIVALLAAGGSIHVWKGQMYVRKGKGFSLEIFQLILG